MRKADREITDPGELEQLLREGEVVYLGLWDGEEVYVVPLNYGYRDHALYLHCALEGRKIDLLKRNPKVSFAITVGYALVRAEQACGWSTHFRSLTGTGTAVFLEGEAAKRDGLNALMGQFTATPQEYRADVLPKTAVIQVDIEKLTGKQH